MLRAHHRFRAMGSPCEIRIYGESRRQCDALARVGIDETQRLEQKYSRYRDDSVTSAINASAGDGAGVEVDAETARLLDYAETAWRESGELFDATSGVLVTDVAPGSSGEQAGIRPGDAILEINRKPVTDVETFRRLVAAVKPGEVVPVYLERGGGQHEYVVLSIPDSKR